MFLIACLTVGDIYAAQPTAVHVTQKAASVITQAKGISLRFSVNAGGKAVSGTLKSDGMKFCVSLPQGTTWYNGKNMYSYNPRTSETTVTTPTAQELAESNPLLYVKSGATSFTSRFSKEKRPGKYVIELSPRNQKTGIKKLTFTINSANYHIERIVAVTSSGTSTVDVTSLKTGVRFPASEFEYPKSKYPSSEIIDLR